MKIAYIDHSYHAKTGSNVFLVDLLRSRGHTVTLFWDESWRGGDAISFDAVNEYDVIIMFQSQCFTRSSCYSKLHKNVVYIPMLDQFPLYNTQPYDLHYVLKKFRRCKVVSFSVGLHCAMMAHGLKSFPVKYYPTPVKLDCAQRNGLRAFFWIRREDMISWPMIRCLMGDTVFENVHLHIAPDPSSPPITLPSDEEKEKYNITTSNWFETKEDFLCVMQQANVFFASRMMEGIGQSFLEAMGRGQCVVAPDCGTMNEYIVHGVNGLLYNPNDIAALDFSNISVLGRNAHASVRAGHLRWEESKNKLINFILTQNSEFYSKKWFTTYVCWLRSLDILLFNKILDGLQMLYRMLKK